MLGLLFATAALAAPAQDAAAVTASESAPSIVASTVEVVGDFRLLMEESSSGSGSGSEAISSSTSVVVSMTAMGDISDYDAAAQSWLVSNMAGALGVAPVDVSLTVSAASVNLVFTVAVADGAAAAVVSAAVASALPTADAASFALGAVVLSAPTAATFDDEVSPPPPPTPPPPPPPPPFSPGEVPVEAVTFIFTVDTDFNGGSADGSDIDIDALRAAFASSAGVGTQKEDVVATYVSGTVVIVIEVEEGASAALMSAVFDDAKIIQTVQSALGADVAIVASASSVTVASCDGSVANCYYGLGGGDDDGMNHGAVAAVVIGVLLAVGGAAVGTFAFFAKIGPFAVTSSPSVELEGNNSL